jgi:hypothetical protein
MPLSIEKIRFIAVYGTIIALILAAVFIIVEYPEILNPAEKQGLQILSRNGNDGRNESGNTNVNFSFIIVIKNVGESNESKTLVCSVSYQNAANAVLTFSNRTLVTLAPGETRTYYPVVILPDSAKSVNWDLNTFFE